MPNTGKMQLNKLNYDRDREVVDFVIRRKLGETAIIIHGEVPVMILSAGEIRGFAKAAVRQALIDAADALTEAGDETEEDEPADEGTHPEDLNAANDD